MFPTEGDCVCSWRLQQNPTNREHCAVAPLQKGPSVPRTWPSHTSLHCHGENERDVLGWCDPAGLQNKPAPISIGTHILPPPHTPPPPTPTTASQPLAAFPANTIPITACQRWALSQGKKRGKKRGRGGEKGWEKRSHLAKGKLLKEKRGVWI